MSFGQVRFAVNILLQNNLQNEKNERKREWRTRANSTGMRRQSPRKWCLEDEGQSLLRQVINVEDEEGVALSSSGCKQHVEVEKGVIPS